MNKGGWETLLCSYFYKACIKELTTYFYNNGFVPKKNKVGGVTYLKNNIFFEVSYDPESYPKYILSLVIGIGTGAYDDWGKFTGIPIWSVIPDNDSIKYTAWSFTNEDELINILIRVRDNIIEEYAKPLWEDKAKLELEFNKFKK